MATMVLEKDAPPAVHNYSLKLVGPWFPANDPPYTIPATSDEEAVETFVRILRDAIVVVR